MKDQFTYKKAGVDIGKAERSLEKLKASIAATHNRQVLKNIGAFGGFYELPAGKYRNPVLVASTDGVGTKLKVAVMANRHGTVGQDLVNHCIDDIAVCGAEPLFFLDYFASGELDETTYAEVMHGFATACKQAGVPLIGGETAEMPDLYSPGEYDLAGTIVGIVEKDDIIDGSAVDAGDVLIGVGSNGLHTNGYSLARKVLFSRYQPDEQVPELGGELAAELLRVHLNYLPVIRDMREQLAVKGMAHITGGGLPKNTARVVPRGLRAAFDWGSLPVPPIFNLIQKTGNVPEEDMRITFNLGIGLVFIVSPEEADAALRRAEKFGHGAWRIGKIVTGE